MRRTPGMRTWLTLPLMVVTVGALGSAHASPRTLRVGRDGPTVQATVDAAHAGDVIEVGPGDWAGPVTLDKAVTLRGTGGQLTGGGQGRVLTVSAPGARAEGLRIIDSGDDLSDTDACIYVTKPAAGAVIENNKLRGCAFGIWVHETQGAVIKGNSITGSETGHRSNRGNGIQLFNASNLTVVKNKITGGRDGIYVSATEDSLIEGNRIERSRYGVHYMFSYSNTVTNNVAINNGSGYAIMSSHHLNVSGNEARGNEDHGILFRDVQYSSIRDNLLLANGEGLFFYSSTENKVIDNEIRANEVGAKIWAGSVRNEVSGNSFVGNRRQIFYISTQELAWGEDGPGNRWGDYLGWDQNGDGMGDRPYRVDSFTTRITYKCPSAVLLLRSPSLELLSHLEQRLPVFRTPTLIDHSPLMGDDK